jgi:hypothetical protein
MSIGFQAARKASIMTIALMDFGAPWFQDKNLANKHFLW